MSVEETSESRALNHFEMGKTTEELLETRLALKTDPKYSLVLEKDDDKTSRLPGKHYRHSPESELYGELDLDDIEVERDEIEVEKISLNPDTGEARLEFESRREEEPRRYRILDSNDEEIALLAEIGYGERETAQLKYEKQTGKIKGRKDPDDSWKNYNGVREEYRVELIEKIITEVEKLREEPEQEFTGSKFQHLRPVYNAVTEKIERNGEAVINEQTHVGSARGADIANNFFSAAVRHPEDSPDNYEESSGKGRFPIIITEK